MSPAAPRADGALDRRDAVALGALLVLGSALRGTYLLLLDVPRYDPWRHLALLRNLREGLGFTLFDGQPYLWYSPLWYVICAAMPRGVGMEHVAAFCSWLCVAAIYLLLRGGYAGGGRRAAFAGGLMMAAAGPVVRFTCHYGPEGLALLLCLGAVLLAARRPGTLAALAAGIAFGLALVLRLNFAFNVFLFLPVVRRPRRMAALAGGTALPLALTWWRNHRIIAAHDWLFTWDGLATRCADFNALSTLVVQMHPAVRAGLRRLHEAVVPQPEWIRGPGGTAWATMLFVILGLAGVAACRRLAPVLAAGSAVLYFLVLDRSLSANFFRIWLAVFPAFFLGLALCAERLRARRGTFSSAAAVPLVGVFLLAGAGMLLPAQGPALELVTPPDGLLDQDAYAVNSGFYHPESLIWRYPDRRFVGLPLDPADFEDYRRAFPGYREILWHDFSVQSGLAAYLSGPGGYRVVKRGANSAGRAYVVLAPGS